MVRTTIQALAAVLGGTQSPHQCLRRGVGAPHRESALLALRTQQVLAHESGVTATVDPLGSYFVEALTDAVEEKATELLDRIEGMGGAVAAIEEGWMQARIEESAYDAARRQSSGEMVVVGVNRFVTDSGSVPVMDVDPDLERKQVERLARCRSHGTRMRWSVRLPWCVRRRPGRQPALPDEGSPGRRGHSLSGGSAALRDVFGQHKPSGASGRNDSSVDHGGGPRTQAATVAAAKGARGPWWKRTSWGRRTSARLHPFEDDGGRRSSGTARFAMR